MPASFTLTTASFPSRRTVSQTGLPRSLYLTALLSRLHNACASRVLSASTYKGSSGSVTVSSWSCCLTSASHTSRALPTSAARLIRSLRRGEGIAR